MTDYISREALLSATDGYDWQAGLKTVLKRIPSANVWPAKWSLCEEKQPPQGRYLCVRQLFNGDFSYDVCSFAEDLNKVDKYYFPKNLYKGIGGWFDYDSETGYFQTSVYAWMPLPQAPKEE